MADWVSAAISFLLAFTVATLITAAELITSKYPRTMPFALRSKFFYLYVAVYGALGVAALALLPVFGDAATLSGPGLADPWIKAAVVGFCIKAFLHINIFTVTRGPGNSYPIGLESLVNLFEPWILRELELEHYFTERAFIAPRVARVPDLATAKATAIASIPTAFTPAEKAAMAADINQETTVEGVIGIYLRYVGIAGTKATFPDR